MSSGGAHELSVSQGTGTSRLSLPGICHVLLLASATFFGHLGGVTGCGAASGCTSHLTALLVCPERGGGGGGRGGARGGRGEGAGEGEGGGGGQAGNRAEHPGAWLPEF